MWASTHGPVLNLGKLRKPRSLCSRKMQSKAGQGGRAGKAGKGGKVGEAGEAVPKDKGGEVRILVEAGDRSERFGKSRG
jgi:hypothetical protein